jgi:hypothetical protein
LEGKAASQRVETGHDVGDGGIEARTIKARQAGAPLLRVIGIRN